VSRIIGYERETFARKVKRKSKVTAVQFPSIKITEIDSKIMKRKEHVGTEKYLGKFIVKHERKKLLCNSKHKTKCIILSNLS
jgi:hypothetical protein